MLPVTKSRRDGGVEPRVSPRTRGKSTPRTRTLEEGGGRRKRLTGSDVLRFLPPAFSTGARTPGRHPLRGLGDAPSATLHGFADSHVMALFLHSFGVETILMKSGGQPR